MHEAMLWCAFLGAWLLVAGPLYQAALELNDEDVERDRLHETYRSIPKPDPISVWWWLVPPAKYVLERRRDKAVRHATMAALSQPDREALVSFANKAFAWLMVSGGGLLLALNETYLLVHGEEWSVGWFWVLVVVMLLASIGNTVGRMTRSRDLLGRVADDETVA